jgi:hypothetical protein
VHRHLECLLCRSSLARKTTERIRSIGSLGTQAWAWGGGWRRPGAAADRYGVGTRRRPIVALLVPPSFSGTPHPHGRPPGCLDCPLYLFLPGYSLPIVLGYPGPPAGRRTVSSCPYLRWYGSERSTDLWRFKQAFTAWLLLRRSDQRSPALTH